MGAAAIVIPILASLEPVFAPLVVRLIEKIFPPKSGSVKLPVVGSIIQAALDGLVKTGSASQTQVPAAGEIIKFAQTIVDDLKAKGELNGPATVLHPEAVATAIAAVAPEAAAALQSGALRILAILESIAPAFGVKPNQG